MLNTPSFAHCSTLDEIATNSLAISSGKSSSIKVEVIAEVSLDITSLSIGVRGVASTSGVTC